MAPDAPQSESCQLESRHWTLTDERGNVERVEGPGVVGTYPTMRPGTEYTWISSTSFSTPTGVMGGHFLMRNLRSGECLCGARASGQREFRSECEGRVQTLLSERAYAEELP